MTARPITTVTLTADGRGWVDDAEVPVPPGSTLEQARVAVLQVVTGIAEYEQRSVWVRATGPDGRYEVVVHPDGRIDDARTSREMTENPDAQRAPEAYREQMAAIATAAATGQHPIAAHLAQQLLDQAMQDYKEDGHPYVLRVQELRAHTLLEGGNAAEAVEAYLAVARGWAQRGSASYWGAAQRAYACWHRISEPAQAIWLGDQLVGVLRIGGEDASATLRQVLRRLDELRTGLVG
ncbi:hypothetical protein [Streptantibioticus ferralitis]|uniref:Uncharacterized protein n=1 Tax=Streptantibioticus ferralitis TaxID=236510 RepID=A0ABT5ZAP2_9ACTN|nr:hypothetical protein [Streptantibioticus ferralitis]MDF2260915.1 hypothetical protein [Streptantibioticus ferralitis]